MIQADYIAKAAAEGRVAEAEAKVEFASKTNTKVWWGGWPLPERVPLPDFAGDEFEPGFADVIDYNLSAVYEIKHYPSRWIGFADAVWYRDHLDMDPKYQGFAPWRLGGLEGYPEGFVTDWPTDPDALLSVNYTMPGVITYTGIAKPKKVLDWCLWGVFIWMTGNLPTMFQSYGGAQQPLTQPAW